ncbi:pyruvate formate lyase family protein [Chloroflexota bacterium]
MAQAQTSLFDEAIERLIVDEHSTRQTAKILLRSAIYNQAYSTYRKDPVELRLAKALAQFLTQKEVVVLESDVLAGHAQYYDYKPSIPIHPSGLFDIDQEVKTYLTDHETDSTQAEQETLLEKYSVGIDIKLFKRWGSGHVIAGYDQVLEKGYGWFIQSAQQATRSADTNVAVFAQASLIVCEATSAYILRYAVKAREAAQEAGPAKATKHLNRIADACDWVANQTPRTFFEAVQLLWLTHEVLIYENHTGSMSLGRLDQYLYPFYEKDIDEGNLTFDEASFYIEALWLKFSNLVNGFQNVTLGGCNADGSYAANDLSVICLRASRKLKMDQPLISVRWDPQMTGDFWNEIQALIETGTGFPALFNDNIAISAKTRVGISEKDARNYGIVGCVELSVPGKEYSNTEQFRFNWAKVVELVLNSGKCACTGETIALKTQCNLQDFATFEQFYGWFIDEFKHYLEIGLSATNLLDENYGNHWPNPLLSSLMEGCLQNSKDVTSGGTIYNNSAANACGMANTADSLMAIKQVVFKDRLVSLPELAEALRNNFEGQQKLHRSLLKCPKYGNDNDEVDAIFIDLAECFVQYVSAFDTPRGGAYQVGLYSVSDHATMGTLTGALPDGRKRSLSLANALSPAQGADILGPTAVLKSITKIDHTRAGNGLVLDLKFHPDFFKSSKHRQAFRQLVESYFALGGLEIQFNVVSRETLINAQKNPEQYRNLVVRVSGFSAYFISLDKTLQDEIIARTEYAYIS